MQYTGLDVHKQFIQATTVSDAGALLRQWRMTTDRETLTRFAQSLGPDDALCLESTTNALPIYRLLTDSPATVVISNPLQTKAIAAAKVKTDKVDSETLAQLLRADYLPSVWVPDEPTLRLRGLCSYREALVRQRTQVKNRIHAILHRNLIPRPAVRDLFGKSGLAYLRAIDLPAHERAQLEAELLLIELLDAQIADAGRQAAEAATEPRQVELLLSIPGVSHTTAIGLLATIGQISRFANPKKLVSYLGLDPMARSSADHQFGSTRISKRGRSHARWLLVEAATAAVKVPGPLQSFYLRLRRKKGHNKAIVATARKLACLAWHILTHEQPYIWAPPERTREKIRRFQILAGAPREKSGTKPGQPSRGGRAGRLARRKADHDPARAAQADYEQLVTARMSAAQTPEASGSPDEPRAPG